MLAACATTPGPAGSPDYSSYACMRAALAQLPAGLPEARAHCIASALIARRCSAIEAQLAGTGKELRDLFTRGDASWDDWRADRAGIACARDADVDLASCCEGKGF